MSTPFVVVIYLPSPYLTIRQSLFVKELIRNGVSFVFEVVSAPHYIPLGYRMLRAWDRLAFKIPFKEKCIPLSSFTSSSSSDSSPPKWGLWLGMQPLPDGFIQAYSIPIIHLVLDYSTLYQSPFPCVEVSISVAFKGNYLLWRKYACYCGQSSWVNNETHAYVQGWSILAEALPFFTDENLPQQEKNKALYFRIGAYVASFIEAFQNSYIRRRNPLRWKVKMAHQPCLLSFSSDVFEELENDNPYEIADPFPVHFQGKDYVFVEEIEPTTGKGFLSVAEIDEEGKPIWTHNILPKPHHLSFPFVFEWEGKMYLMPETHQSQSIELYEATHFPTQWQQCHILGKDIEAVDSILYFYESRWWLFTTKRAPLRNYSDYGFFDTLWLYYAESPFADTWTAHPQNPIVTDVRNARNGGRIFTKDGKMYRVAQMITPFYGRGVSIREILLLTPTHYQESPSSLSPEEIVMGVHTFNFNKNLTCIDILESKER